MRVLLVDKNWASRLGISQFLAALDPAHQVGEAANLKAARAHLRKRQKPDLCLLDFHLERGDPIDALRDIRAHGAGIPIIVFTSGMSRRLVLASMEEGASGFVLKSAPPEDLKTCIEHVMRGEIWLPVDLRDMSAGPLDGTEDWHPRGAEVFDVLTPRQRQVLDLIATGKRNADIAAALGISPRTVQIHVSTILKLLKVKNRTEAALLAHSHRHPRARS